MSYYVGIDGISCKGYASAAPDGIPGKLLQPESTDLNHDDGADGTGGLNEFGNGHIGSSLISIS